MARLRITGGLGYGQWVPTPWTSGIDSGRLALDGYPQTVAVGLAEETDTALSVALSQTVAIGLAEETDTAPSVFLSQTVAIGLAEETDTALAVTASAVVSVAVGPATETDSIPGAVGFVKTIGLAIYQSLEQALVITHRISQTVAIGLAEETDAALAVSALVAQTVAIGLAEETDTALAASATIVDLATATLPRPDAEPPAWLLTVDIGGSVAYLSTRGIEVPSRAAGGTRAYAPGLPPLEVEVGSVVGVALAVAPPDPVPGTTRLRGRPWDLRLWRGEAWAELAQVVARGVVAGASWGAPDAPGVVELDLGPEGAAPSRPLLPAHAIVERGAWPNAGDDVIGEAVPLVIGRPGSTAPLGRYDRDAYPATPAVQIDPGGGSRTWLVACHDVAAATVSVWDLTDEPALVTSSASVIVSTDWQGRPVATIAIALALLPADRTKIYVGWTGGGGITWGGREIRGLGTALLWMATVYGRGGYDLRQIEARRAELDALLVDGVINDPATTWVEWVDSVVDVLGVERVEGVDGVWWERGVWVPDPRAVRATLVADAGGGGRPVVRTTAYAEEDVDLASEVRVYYAQHGEVRWPRQVAFAAETDPDDPRVVGHPACARSAALGSGAPRIVYAATSDPSTAWAAARSQADRYATPAYLATYAGGPELGERLRRGDTVEIVEDGETRLGVVRSVVLSEAGTSITVRVPLL